MSLYPFYRQGSLGVEKVYAFAQGRVAGRHRAGLSPTLLMPNASGTLAASGHYFPALTSFCVMLLL